jgi:hypothetical protein
MASSYNYRQPEGCTVIFRPWRRTKDGTLLWAKHYGKKAWRIVLRDGKEVNSDGVDGGTKS